MAFRFTDEDFQRYVKKEEHGGVHIWDVLLEKLETGFRIPFSVGAYEKRGDRLKLLWFSPKNSSRKNWRFQSKFFFSRDMESQELMFGLNVQRPPIPYFEPANAEEKDWDPDSDGARFFELLQDDVGRRDIESLCQQFQLRWRIEVWDNVPVYSGRDTQKALVGLESISEDDGVTIFIERSIGAKEAVETGESIGDVIFSTFENLSSLWELIIPEQDYNYVDSARSNFWLFQANPQYYDLATDLNGTFSGVVDSWTVTRYREEMKAGDMVFIWQAGAAAGIYAVGILLDDPVKRVDDASPGEIESKPYLSSEWVVEFEYALIPAKPLLKDELRTHPILGNMQVIRSPQATNFKVTYEEAKAINDILTKEQQREPDRDSFADARAVIESMLPNADAREIALNLLADYIVEAHKMGPSSWEVTLFSDKVRLNVGKIQTFLIRPDLIYLLLDANVLDEADIGELDDAGQTQLFEYKAVSGVFDTEFHYQKAASVTSVVNKGFTPLIAKAVQSSRISTYQKSHSPGIIKYLRKYLKRDIPSPAYEGDQMAITDINTTICNALANQGLQFTPWQIATFYTALQTKGFVILSGISGTGKTKLAQGFAQILPQPQFQPETKASDDVISLTAQPYMLKYKRIIIPKRGTRLFEPPAPNESVEVMVNFDDKSQACRLTHSAYGTTDYINLLLRGEAGSWFSTNFKEGDQIIVTPLSDEDGILYGFNIDNTVQQYSDINQDIMWGNNWLFVPVRPDWRDSKSLLGYYNPLTSAYEWTPFLRFILRAVKSHEDGDGLAWFAILDEMNLARVEYYFADLLSVLESGRDGENGRTNEPLRLVYPEEAEGDLPPAEIYLPPNLYVAGTVNVDETTHAFSPKVLDRAFTIEFTSADFSDYPPRQADQQARLESDIHRALLANFTSNGKHTRTEKGIIAAYLSRYPNIRSRLQALYDLLQPFELHFGYRVFDEITTFMASAELNRTFDNIGGSDAAFDAAVLMKILPKFHGSRGRLEQPLKAVLAWCINPDEPDRQAIDNALEGIDASSVIDGLMALSYQCQHTAARATRMMWALYTNGFAAFG